MGRLLSGNRSAGATLRADRRAMPPALAAGTRIAVLNAAFGAGTSYAVVGTAPDQLTLSGGAIVAGSAGGSEGSIYAVKVRATSADGKREVAETLSFLCQPADPVALLVVIGDSNARGAAANEASLDYTNDPLTTTWDGSAFVPYRPGVRTGVTVPNTLAGSDARVGPEMQFARAWRAAYPALPLAIVKYARAGSFQGYAAGAPVNGDAGNSWDPANGSLLAGARAQVQAASAALTQSGRSPRTIAIIDASGTNDGGDATLAAGVQATKAAMYAAIRSGWPIAPGTLILTQRTKADSPQPNLAAVRAGQMAVAQAGADVVLIDTDAMSDNGAGDRTHFDLAGQMALGQAHHAAFASRINRRAALLGAKLALMVDAGAADTIGHGAAPAVASLASVAGARTLTQGTAARQPVLVPDAIAGRPALDFDGSDDGLALAGANNLGTGDREGFAIVTSDAPAAIATPGAIYARGGGSDPADLRLGRTVVGGVSRFRLRVGIGGSSAYQVVDNQVVAEGGPFVLYWRIVGQTAYLSVNGRTEQSAALTAAPAIGNASLYIGQANASQWFDGRIRMVGETATLTTAERDALLADLMAEAGL